MIAEDFVIRLEAMQPKDLLAWLKREERNKSLLVWSLRNEIRPVDLYCYLGARFGAPNGFQNFLRQDDSDNLVHWEWVVKVDQTILSIQGLNFRTDIFVFNPEALKQEDREECVSQLKASFSAYGAAMGDLRRHLEHWVEFVNPYQRLRRAVNVLAQELWSLELDVERDRIPDILQVPESERSGLINRWDEVRVRYSRAFGLGFGIRSMLPVMAEAFVNLLLYCLMKQELKQDVRLRENVIRQPVDIRIRSLSHNCTGFDSHIDYTTEACRRFHSLVNERNDLLHGNVVIDKLKFGEVYFNGKVPIFSEYSSMWDRSLGVAHDSVGIESIKAEIAVVDGLIEYLLSCLNPSVREMMRHFIAKFDLGLRPNIGRVGILFSDRLTDFVMGGGFEDRGGTGDGECNVESDDR